MIRVFYPAVSSTTTPIGYVVVVSHRVYDRLNGTFTTPSQSMARRTSVAGVVKSITITTCDIFQNIGLVDIRDGMHM